MFEIKVMDINSTDKQENIKQLFHFKQKPEIKSYLLNLREILFSRQRWVPKLITLFAFIRKKVNSYFTICNKHT